MFNRYCIIYDIRKSRNYDLICKSEGNSNGNMYSDPEAYNQSNPFKDRNLPEIPMVGMLPPVEEVIYEYADAEQVPSMQANGEIGNQGNQDVAKREKSPGKESTDNYVGSTISEDKKGQRLVENRDAYNQLFHFD